MPVENTLITFDYKKNSTRSYRIGYENRCRGTVEVNETRSGIFKRLIIDSKGSTEKCYMLVFDTDKLGYRKFKMKNVKNLKNGIDRSKPIERNSEEEAKARNNYMKVCYGNIPSYSLWTSSSVGLRSDWNLWWEEFDKDIIKNNKLKIMENYNSSPDDDDFESKKIKNNTKKRKRASTFRRTIKRKIKNNTININLAFYIFAVVIININAILFLFPNCPYSKIIIILSLPILILLFVFLKIYEDCVRFGF